MSELAAFLAGCAVVYVVMKRKTLGLPAGAVQVADQVADAADGLRVSLWGEASGGVETPEGAEAAPRRSAAGKGGCGCGGAR